MRSTSRPTRRPPLFAVLVILALAGGALFALPPSQDDARAAVAAAYAKLDDLSSYRKVETLPASWSGLTARVTTEIQGNRRRQTVVMDTAEFGRVYVENIRVGSRAALLVVAPGVVTRIARTRFTTDMAEARQLLQEIFALSDAIRIAPSSSATGSGGRRDVMALHTPEDARRALDQAAGEFGVWQRCDDRPELGGHRIQVDGEVVLLGLQAGARGDVVSYVYRSTSVAQGAIPGEKVIRIGVQTGLPITEEVRGEDGGIIARTDFHAAPWATEFHLPVCLR